MTETHINTAITGLCECRACLAKEYRERESNPSTFERGPVDATLRTPSGAALRIDIDERSQALKLTIDADGKQASAVLPAKSASTFQSMLGAMLDAARDAR